MIRYEIFSIKILMDTSFQSNLVHFLRNIVSAQVSIVGVQAPLREIKSLIKSMVPLTRCTKFLASSC